METTRRILVRHSPLIFLLALGGALLEWKPIRAGKAVIESREIARQAPAQVLAAYRRLPLSFEADDSQVDHGGGFLARGDGYTLFLTSAEAVLFQRRSALRMKLIGADPRARANGLQPLPGTANYFLGNDPRKWRTNIRRYARLRYANVYPGIDLVYYGNQGRLEYDFVVSPGARPEAITLGFEGAEAIRADSRGDLLVKAGGEEVRLLKPYVYQHSSSAIQPVESRYVLASNGRVAFQIFDYDRRKELVIDPVLSYSTYLGGSRQELGNAIAVDSSGNAYVTGWTTSTDFPTTSGAFRRTGPSGGFGQDVFVSKVDSRGALVYSTYLGGDFTDSGNGIAVDASGNAYVTGQTNSSNFPVTPGSLKTTNTGTSPLLPS